MKTRDVVLITVSAAVLIGGTIVAIKLLKSKNDNKEGEEADIIDSDEQTEGEIGKLVKTHPTLGYTNVRSTPTVDDGWMGTWFGYRPTEGNFIGEAKTNPIGTITRAVTGDDGHTWYKVKLKNSINGKTEGYVRQDAVSF